MPPSEHADADRSLAWSRRRNDVLDVIRQAGFRPIAPSLGTEEMWYGPAGIGTTRGLQGFVDFHQLPFRVAFPNRQGGDQWNDHPELKQRLGGGHYIHIGDGPYAVTGGWPSVYAMHTGGDFAGVGPTGREVTMRVMDFYLLHEGLIRENWVPLDILDLLKQMDMDVLDRMRSHFQRGAWAG